MTKKIDSRGHLKPILGAFFSFLHNPYFMDETIWIFNL